MNDLWVSFCVPLLALAALPPVATRARGRLEGPETLALAAGLALVWCMAGGMLLGFSGALNRGAVFAWLALGVVASLAGSAWSARRAGRGLRELVAELRESWRGFATAALLLPGLAIALLLATVPPWYRDSLAYHLSLPRFFAQSGGFAYPDDNLFAAFPLGWQSALALLHALGAAPDFDPVFNPRLVGAWTLGAVGLASVALARAAGASRPLASLAGALLLMLPTSLEFGASAYVENALMLLTALALWSVLRVATAEASPSQDSPSRSPAWLASALLAGAVCWIKYPGLAVLLFVGVAATWFEYRRRAGAGLAAWTRLAVVWFAAAGVVASPFFVRNVLWRGNPVFPTAYGVFGGSGWDEWRAWAYGVTLANYGYGREFIDYVLLPVRLFTQRDFHGGFEGSLGPLVGAGFIAAVVLVASSKAGERERTAARVLLGWIVWASLFWALTVQQTRFYLVVVPALLAATALGLSRLAGEGPGAMRRSALLIAACLAFQVAWSATSVTELWQRQATSDWIAGRIDREGVLARMLPESHAAVRGLERHVPEDGRVWLVWTRGYTYYLRRPYRQDSVFEAWRLEQLLDEVETPAAFGTALRSDGITHLLVNERFFLANGNADLRPGRTDLLRQRFDAARSGGVLRVVERWGSIALYAVGLAATPPN